ncbi:uncharacterized protein LOC122029245 [Zingiber officinale]|uniref:Uncharacterized protein n=1 Tax=Zingiber officinale TaxID=94328 RepID=A0A8J5HZD9_ZINOF|nr:uncharacterized protein LOC122029245 [Zingiber officinale]KAG6536967.1 hypothetical protein ZIOFF_002045 [Zingiber officinale]
MTTAVAGRYLNLLSAPAPLPTSRRPPSSALHQLLSCNKRRPGGGRVTRSTAGFRARCGLLPVDPWAPTLDSQSVASQLFAVSLFPYLGFLYYITKSNTAPKLTLFGFYFLLAFVGATIPAGIYAKVHYGTSLSNVDWLHGGAESLLTLTNLFIVLGLREALRKMKDTKKNTPPVVSDTKEKSSV